eukprot:snap_masked-scaffold_71-processed-gene-0.18-mRNA-1 protein AED:0.12 eAED:0.12 QI:0/0/0/1/1/1/2/0/417
MKIQEDFEKLRESILKKDLAKVEKLSEKCNKEIEKVENSGDEALGDITLQLKNELNFVQALNDGFKILQTLDEPLTSRNKIKNQLIHKKNVTKNENQKLSLPQISNLSSGLPSVHQQQEVKAEFKLINIKDINLKDIIGLEDEKESLKEVFVYPSILPKEIKETIKPWKGVLLFGPPGTGKTRLAKAICCEFNLPMINIRESEKLVRDLFSFSRENSPCLLFFDEIDSCFDQRGKTSEHEASKRMKSELLIQLDGATTENKDSIYVLAATNFPWDLDEALIRRLEKRIYIPLPKQKERIQLLEYFLSKQKGIGSIKLTKKDLYEISVQTKGYSGSDINVISRKVVMQSIKKLISKVEKNNNFSKDNHERIRKEIKANLSQLCISKEDFLSAIETNKPSTNLTQLNRYQNWMENFGAM